MPTDIVDPAEPQALIDAWLERQLAENPIVVALDRDPQIRRWYLRMRGEDRDFIAIWITLGQRTLRYEVYFMPAPEEREGELYEYLLRCNQRLFAMRFAIGAENAIYLVGQLPITSIDEAELDRVVGSAYEAVERYFRPAMRIGFGAKFKG